MDLVDGGDFEITSINGYLAKGRYHFGENNTRFFAGLMLGMYSIQPGAFNENGNITINFQRKMTFGFAPEIGVRLGSFQIATSYHLPGKYKADVLTGTYEAGYSVWQFTIGWNIEFVDN